MQAMKRHLTLLFLVLLSNIIWAAQPGKSPSNLFQDELSCLDEAFGGIAQLEQEVAERHATYSQLALENNSLLKYVTSENQDISASLLGASGQLDETLKIILIVLAVVGMLAIGCCLALVIWGNSWYW